MLGLVLSGSRQQLWPNACCLLAPQDPLCVTGVPGVTLQFEKLVHVGIAAGAVLSLEARGLSCQQVLLVGSLPEFKEV